MTDGILLASLSQTLECTSVADFRARICETDIPPFLDIDSTLGRLAMLVGERRFLSHSPHECLEGIEYLFLIYFPVQLFPDAPIN